MWDWRTDPVVEWLVTEGEAADGPAGIVEGVSLRLVDSGLPLRRFSIGLTTLHPEVVARFHRWVRGRGIEEQTSPRSVLAEPEYLASPAFLIEEGAPEVRRRLDGGDRLEFDLYRMLRAAGDTDYLALPLKLRHARDNLASWTTDRPGGFNDAELARLGGLAPFIARAIEPHALRLLAGNLLNLYVGRDTGARILGGQIVRGSGESILAALWACDLVDFTRLSAALPAQSLIDLLNRFFDIVAGAIEARGGEVLKFLGDGMLAIFPVADAAHPEAACTAAFESTRDAYFAVEALNAERRDAAAPPVRFGVGLHLGEAVYGNVGGRNRIDFTMIGPAVNLVARLEALCRPLGQPAIASSEFAATLPGAFRSLGTYPLKGIAEPVEVFGVDEEDEEHGAA